MEKWCEQALVRPGVAVADRVSGGEAGGQVLRVVKDVAVGFEDAAVASGKVAIRLFSDRIRDFAMKNLHRCDPSWTLRLRLVAAGVVLGALAACASSPTPDSPSLGPAPAPGAQASSEKPAVPVDPAALIDEAEPDPIGVLSRRLESPPPEAPAVAGEEQIGEGMASFYGRKFHGRRTASGERFDMSDFTAAHRSLPFGTKVRVRNLRNGKEVVVRINDRGLSRRVG
ncbi:MAG: septal ring lytic transglycosylase RlpA family protein [Burkholderiaceae bacterium]